MTEFKAGDKVRINEGLLEGQTGTVIKWGQHVTLVSLEDTAFGGGSLTFYTEALVSAAEYHESLAHLKSLYPDFLKSDRYLYRLTTYVNGVFYTSAPIRAGVLVETLERPPAGLERVEFMLREDDPTRGLAWKMLWSA